MSSKFHLIGTALSVALILMSAAAASAGAAPVWLESKGEEVKSKTTAVTEETITIVHEGGSLGKAKLECAFDLNGTVGAGSADEVTLLTSLTGEQDLIGNCKNIEGFCVGAVVHPINLPWSTSLAEEPEKSGTIWDKYAKTGFSVLCVFGIMVTCEGSLKSKLKEAKHIPAEFSYLGAESGGSTCSDGGSAKYEGKASVKGFSAAKSLGLLKASPQPLPWSGIGVKEQAHFDYEEFPAGAKNEEAKLGTTTFEQKQIAGKTGEFKIVAGRNFCENAKLAVGQSCLVEIEYTGPAESLEWLERPVCAFLIQPYKGEETPSNGSRSGARLNCE